FFRKVRWLTERNRKEAELREELQFHLEEEADERQALGLAEDQARWAARRELGSIALVLDWERPISLDFARRGTSIRTTTGSRSWAACAPVSVWAKRRQR